MYLWNSKYLKSIADTSVIACDEVISVMDIVSTEKTNTIAKKVPRNCHGKKVSYIIDCYILHLVLLMIKLLLIIAIISYHYGRNRSKQRHWCTNNIKMENNEF